MIQANVFLSTAQVRNWSKLANGLSSNHNLNVTSNKMLHRSQQVTPSLNKSQTENQSPQHCQWSISLNPRRNPQNKFYRQDEGCTAFSSTIVTCFHSSPFIGGIANCVTVIRVYSK